MCTACETALISLPEVTALPAPVELVALRQPLRRREPAAPVALLQLEPQQSLRIVDAGGRPLLDITWSEAGPVLQLAGESAELAVDGAFRLSADTIDMLAHNGPVRVLAKDDVVIRGEKVRLN